MGLTSRGAPHPHAFSRRGSYVRTATVTYDDSGQLWVVSGVRDLIVLTTTDSEFHNGRTTSRARSAATTPRTPARTPATPARAGEHD
jgi:urate oxidase